MRISIVGGDDIAEEDLTHLCSALRARGEDVTAHLRTSRPDTRTSRRDRAAVIDSVGPSAAAAVPFIGDWAAELERRWSSNPPDLVHAHGWLGGLAAQLAARRLGLPTVQTFANLAAARTANSVKRPDCSSEQARIEPLLARSATWITAGSSSEADVLARLRRGRAQLSLLPTGVDATYYTPIGPIARRDANFRVVCVEPNGVPYSNFHNAVRGVSKLANVELILAQTTSHDDAAWAGLQRLAGDLNVKDRVRWLGCIDDDALPPLLRSADVVACTPAESPRATTALQAMACEVPVVAADIGALSDTVIHRVTGLMVAPNKPHELAGALKTLQTETFQREGMGAAGRSRAISRFTWNRIAVDALTIYHQAKSRHLAQGFIEVAVEPKGA